MSRTKKRHHFQPEHFLNNFCDETGMLWNHDRITKVSFKTHPVNSGIESYYYRSTREGEDDNKYEDFLASAEQRGRPILKEIIDTKGLPTRGGRDFYILCDYIAVAGYRSPTVRKLAIYSALQSLEMDVAPLGLTLEEISKDQTESEQDPDLCTLGVIARLKLGEAQGVPDNVARHLHLTSMNFRAGHILRSLAESLAERHWQLVISLNSDLQFITSDCSIAFLSNGNAHFTGFGVPDADLYMPISPTLALHARSIPGSANILFASDREVREINSMIVAGANRVVFSGTETFTYIDQNYLEAGPIDWLNSQSSGEIIEID